MTTVRVSGLVRQFGGKSSRPAVDDISLEIGEGEMLVLLGPSGCGKTTTLRMLAGLETPDQGRIEFGERVIFDADEGVNVPAHKRRSGMVFQSFALWPHMTVAKNVAYPLKRNGTREERSERVRRAVKAVRCEELLRRYPGQLSGGQQQRIALARGLVAEPDLVLFDEPLSNLDVLMREEVRTEIHDLHTRLGFTAVFVTHDQGEALALGDRLAIMRDGRIEQIDGPEAVFEQPANAYVAEFVGRTNSLDLRFEDDRWTRPGLATSLTDDWLSPRAGASEITVRFRPEDVSVRPAGSAVPNDAICVEMTVRSREYGGRHTDLGLELGDTRVHARMPTSAVTAEGKALSLGSPVHVVVQLDEALAFDAAGERCRTRRTRELAAVTPGLVS